MTLTVNLVDNAFTTEDPTDTEDIIVVKDDIVEFDSTKTDAVQNEIPTGELTGGSTYFFVINIKNFWYIVYKKSSLEYDKSIIIHKEIYNENSSNIRYT